MDKNKTKKYKYDKQFINELLKNAKLGDINAKADLMENFKPLVITLAKNVFIKDYDMEDLIQIGNISLLKAIEKYDFNSKCSFSTYAYSAIQKNFYCEIRNKFDDKYETSLNITNEEGFELIDSLVSDINIEETILDGLEVEALREAILKLKPIEQDLIIEVFFKGVPLKTYAKSHEVIYATCAKRKASILKKLRKLISLQ